MPIYRHAGLVAGLRLREFSFKEKQAMSQKNQSTINPAQAIDELIAREIGLFTERPEDIGDTADMLQIMIAESSQYAEMQPHERSEYVQWIMDMRDACLAIAEYREMKELKFMEEHAHGTNV